LPPVITVPPVPVEPPADFAPPVLTKPPVPVEPPVDCEPPVPTEPPLGEPAPPVVETAPPVDKSTVPPAPGVASEGELCVPAELHAAAKRKTTISCGNVRCNMGILFTSAAQASAELHIHWAKEASCGRVMVLHHP
jgi:hypothetical protein